MAKSPLTSGTKLKGQIFQIYEKLRPLKTNTAEGLQLQEKESDAFFPSSKSSTAVGVLKLIIFKPATSHINENSVGIRTGLCSWSSRQQC